MLLALPCGRDHDHIIEQTRAMTTGFIQYLQQKQAAGIVNVAEPETQQVMVLKVNSCSMLSSYFINLNGELARTILILIFYVNFQRPQLVLQCSESCL